MAINFTTSPAGQVPGNAQAVGVPVFAGRKPAASAGIQLDLTFLKRQGFEGKVGEAVALLANDGSTVVAVGLGAAGEVDADVLRRAGAAFVKAAGQATSAGDRAGVNVTVLDQHAIEREKLGGLVGVSRGSEQPPRLIRMEYTPPGAKTTVVLVGKGITFDSGGLSIKTGDGMMHMK